MEVARQVGEVVFWTDQPTRRATLKQYTNETDKKKLSVLAVDEGELRAHVSEVVRQSVEETLNGLLDAEADALCQARRYERNDGEPSRGPENIRVIFKLRQALCSSECINCEVYPLKLLVLNDTGVVRVRWKRP